jgi:RNA polymerase primary sigma factor
MTGSRGAEQARVPADCPGPFSTKAHNPRNRRFHMFGIVLTPRGSRATRSRPDIDRVNPLPRWETTSPQCLEEPTAGSPRVRPAAEEPSPGLRIFEPESRTARARRNLGMEPTYIAHPSFDDPDAGEAILGPVPAPADGLAPLRPGAPAGVPTYLAGLCEVPLLSNAQEAHLFRKMNYLRFLAERTRSRLDPARVEPRDFEEVARWHGQAAAVRDQIIRANLRLVVSIAKRHAGSYNDITELVSDGNVALIQAVDRFDYARGNKFSTYASWAIINGLKRRKREQNNRARFVTGDEVILQSAADTRADEHDQEKADKQRQREVERLLGRLDDRERRIIASRYGIGGGDEKTRKQIGKELGISKERVRQLEARAENKLRQPAQTEAVDLLLA